MKAQIRHLALIILLVPQASAQIEQTPATLTPPPCNAFTMGEAQSLTFHQKFCYFTEHGILTGSGLFGAAFFSAIAQLRHDPGEWPQGADGFGRRFGSRYAQSLTKSTAEFLVGAINHEDPRPHPPTSTDWAHRRMAPRTVWQRTGQALLRTVWTPRNDRPNGIAWSRIAGSLASGFVGNAWYPDRLATPGQALSRSGSAFGGYAASSVFAEFQPEIFGLAGRLIGIKPHP